MFELFTGQMAHMPRHRAAPILISTATQSLAWAIVILLPVLFMTQNVPDVPTMMAFAVAAPAPPPPPPPPAPKVAQAETKPIATAGLAPVEAPSKIEPEPVSAGPTDGVPGGVEGGIPGGVVGGVVGGLPEAPPPPPPPAPRTPVRTGGQIQAPALLHRVEPEYPALAVKAHLQGMVILEATVDEAGRVEAVKVLRSDAPLLDGSAIAAVKQWQYAPLTLNGKHEPFILTVMLSFHLTEAK